jgi:3',5'-nucleoside bisphosphate phosphatase
MKYKADLHIHTVLSPCADLEMSPINILNQAKKKGLDIIGITDHNSSLQCATFTKIAPEYGIFVLCGAEITTKEETHCLAFFEDSQKLEIFQQYLNQHLPNIQNNTDIFGYQVVVNENDEILYEEEKLLISALSVGLEEIEHKVHSLDGIFIPAHIDKTRFSIISQLGFIPPTLQVEALELSAHTSVEAFLTKNPYLKDYPFIKSSDAHKPDDIGNEYINLSLETISFQAIKAAITQKKFDTTK